MFVNTLNPFNTCSSNAECDDGVFCNGAEFCDAGNHCAAGSDPCPGEACDEVNDVCVPYTCDNDTVCEIGEDCVGCPGDCIGGVAPTCGNSICEAGAGENCLNCPSDCNGRQGGKPSRRYCCGDGAGENPVPCSNQVCSELGNTCDGSGLGSPYCCGDETCEGDETVGNCAIDCDDGGGGGTCLPVGASCTTNADCCSDKCKGKGGNKTCQAA